MKKELSPALIGDISEISEASAALMQDVRSFQLH